jgi:hypothetical protein
MVDENEHIHIISIPTISVYLPPKNQSTGLAITVGPGGGYGLMDWKTHVVYAAQVFNAKGVVIMGLKYRTRPPNGKSNEDIQAIALLDAKRGRHQR